MPRLCRGSWLEQYLEYTRFVEPPGIFHIWSGLTVIASALARKVYMPRGLFKIYPNLYVALVGPTGIGKSTAADIAVRDSKHVLEESGIDIMRGKITSWYLYDWFGTKSGSGAPATALIFASELKTLLGDVNKQELVALLTDLYGCPDDDEYRTKSYGVLRLRDVYLNLLVCSTPEWLTLGISHDDISGGFTGRFIYVCAEHTERSFPFPEDFYGIDEIDKLREVLAHDLSEIAQLEGHVILTDEAKAMYVDWYGTRFDDIEDERMYGYYARRRDHLLKIGALMSIAEGDSLIVTEQHLRTALAILKRAEKTMMLAFAGVVSDPLLKHRELVLGQIKDAGEISRQELLRLNTTRLDLEGLTRLIDTLCAEGRIVCRLDGREMMICYVEGRKDATV